MCHRRCLSGATSPRSASSALSRLPRQWYKPRAVRMTTGECLRESFAATPYCVDPHLESTSGNSLPDETRRSATRRILSNCWTQQSQPDLRELVWTRSRTWYIPLTHQLFYNLRDCLFQRVLLMLLSRASSTSTLAQQYAQEEMKRHCLEHSPWARSNLQIATIAGMTY